MTLSILTVVTQIFGSNETETADDLGPEHIVDAAYGNRNIYDIDEATMGEPRLRDFGSAYFTDYHIVIPLEFDTEVDVSPFVFDVPDQPELLGALEVIANYCGIEGIEEIADLEGKTVPVNWSGNTPSPDVGEMRGIRSGTRDNPNTVDDIERALQKDSE